MENKIDFLAIGDIVIDAFIKLRDAHVNEGINHENRELCVRFGDKVPYESVDVLNAVGNSPNAAVSAARLGLSSALLTYIGDDQNGKDCLASLQKDKVNTKYVFTVPNMKTNYHYVLWYGAERTILVKHEGYPYAFPEIPENVSWIYLSSMAENSLPYHEEIGKYLSAHPETKLAFQPGTFQMKMGTEVLQEIYKNTYLFFCNKEEAERILKMEAGTDMKVLLEGIRVLGPKIVCITDGPNGAHVFDGSEIWFIKQYPDPKPPYDRTGAGDAFSSTFTTALALGKTIPEALSWGPINSMSVVQYVGAQKGLLSKEKLEEYLKNAPEDYKPIKIN